MTTPKLSLEVMSGPLDGLTVTLETDTEWSSAGGGLLSFPWDDELGMPQARFLVEDGNWSVEGHDAPHGTYCVSRGKRIEGHTRVEAGDLLKASETWLLVNQVG